MAALPSLAQLGSRPASLLFHADLVVALGRGALPAGAPTRYPWAAGFLPGEGLLRWLAGPRCPPGQEAGRSPRPCPLAVAPALNFTAPLRWVTGCFFLKGGSGWDFDQWAQPRWPHLSPDLVQGLLALLQSYQDGFLLFSGFPQL